MTRLCPGAYNDIFDGTCRGSTRPERTRSKPFVAREIVPNSKPHPWLQSRRPCRPSRARASFTIRSDASIPGPMYMSLGDEERRQQSQGLFSKFSSRSVSSINPTPPTVRVRLSVDYRVHSRQMLCVGGSAIPLGWSFLSIAKVPMSWEPQDRWVVEFELPAGSKLEYKYVILEEQDWTQQINSATEGTVEYSYRVQPELNPPDVQKITRRMAIVAWQSGPNRVLHVPSEEEIQQVAGSGLWREFEAKVGGAGATWKIARDDGAADGSEKNDISSGRSSSGVEELCREYLRLDEAGLPMLDRQDVWGTEGISRYELPYNSV